MLHIKSLIKVSCLEGSIVTEIWKQNNPAQSVHFAVCCYILLCNLCDELSTFTKTISSISMFVTLCYKKTVWALICSTEEILKCMDNF